MPSCSRSWVKLLVCTLRSGGGGPAGSGRSAALCCPLGRSLVRLLSLLGEKRSMARPLRRKREKQSRCEVLAPIIEAVVCASEREVCNTLRNNSPGPDTSAEDFFPRRLDTLRLGVADNWKVKLGPSRYLTAIAKGFDMSVRSALN